MGTYPFLLSIASTIIPKISATAMFVSVTTPTEIVIPPMPVIKILPFRTAQRYVKKTAFHSMPIR
jgi:hypothetical protein